MRNILIGALALTIGTVAPAMANGDQPFGGEADVSYAADLWTALEEANLAGDDAVRAFPYVGQEPHGAILETLYDDITVGGHTGFAIVKRNFVGEGVSVEAVANSGADFLDSVTVMYQREAGYDADHDNWFWVKYAPDGSVMSNPKGMKLAGRVAKGMDVGCIACHDTAPGDDYLFTTDAMK